MLRLAHDVMNRGLLISQICAVLILQACRKLVAKLLAAPELSLNEVESIVEVLRLHCERSLPNPYAEGIRTEYAWIRHRLSEMDFTSPKLDRLNRQFRRRFRSYGEFFVFAGQLGQQIGSLPAPRRSARYYDRRLARMTDEDYQRECEHFAEFCEELLAEAEKPLPEQDLTFRKLLKIRSKSLLLLSLWGIYPRLGKICARAVAHPRVALGLAVVKRWQLLNGSWPPNLGTALKNAGIHRPLLDPFSGQSLCLKRESGQAVITTADPDGIA